MMPEAKIRYENPETLKVLEDLSKTMGFEIESSNENIELQNAVAAITVPADKEADINQLFQVFTGENLDAKKIRKELWRTKK